METFLRTVERKAYRIAYIGCSNREDALDLVQDTMCRFVDKYSNKPRDEWKALFYKILRNRINDHHRKQTLRKRWMFWLPEQEDDSRDPLDVLAVDQKNDPELQAQEYQMLVKIQQALRQLSLKQQQIFLFRAWEELSTRETAEAMGCSEGTVKTQYFRATRHLKKILVEE